MLNNEVLNKMYKKFMITNTISIRELIQLGLKSKDVKKLILLNYVKMDESGNYIINDVESLYEYGNLLLENGDNKGAYQVFKKCKEFGNKSIDLMFDLYFTSLDNRDYESSSIYYNNIQYNKSR